VAKSANRFQLAVKMQNNTKIQYPISKSWKLKAGPGFTLLETIIAISILSIGVLGVVGLITTSTRALGITKNQAIAANLAQEGVEIVRSVRDTNWIEGEQYNEGLEPGEYCVDYLSMQLDACGDFNLRWDGTGYSHSAGENTPFERRIQIINSTDEQAVIFLEVQSTVSWGDSHSINITSHLYDWR